MFDFKINETGSGGSIEIKGNDVVGLNGFGNMIYLALFGGNYISTPSRRQSNVQALDYWGNNFLLDPKVQFNSTTERVLSEVALNSDGRLQIEKAANFDLAFMKEFANVSINVEIPELDRVKITVILTQPENPENKDFVFIWDGTRTDNSDFTETELKISDSFSPVPTSCEPVTIKVNGNTLGLSPSGSILDINLIDTDNNEVGTIIDTNTVQVPAASTDDPYQDQDVFGNFLIPTRGSERPTNYNLRGADWADQFLATLTSPSPAKEAMIIQLCDDLETAGLWSKIYALYPHMGDNAFDNSLNLKFPYISNGGNIFWQGSPTHGAQFVQGNGTNALGIIPISYQIFNPNDFSMGCYSIDSAYESTQSALMGWGNAFAAYVAFWLSTHASIGGQPAFTTNTYGGKVGIAAAGSARALWSCDINATRRGIYKDGVLGASLTSALNLFQGAGAQIQILNVSNGSYFSARKMGLHYFAKSMDDSAQAVFNTIIQTLITAKGV